MVINKPAGMIVNNADTTKDELTLQEWVEKYLNVDDRRSKLGLENRNLKIDEINQSSTFNLQPQSSSFHNLSSNPYDPVQEFHSRGGIVHRLDKETSGVILVAKNPQSFAKLKEQFMSRTVKKIYLALAHGRLTPEEGEINAPIGRQEFNRMRFGVTAGGREAVTKYKVIHNYVIASKAPSVDSGAKQSHSDNVLSFVQLQPQTGRTHQIRVHLKYLNHPIFADELYAGRKTARDDRKLLPRLFLHASEISFTHPITGEPMHFKAELTEELQNFLDQLEVII